MSTLRFVFLLFAAAFSVACPQSSNAPRSPAPASLSHARAIGSEGVAAHARWKVSGSAEDRTVAIEKLEAALSELVILTSEDPIPPPSMPPPRNPEAAALIEDYGPVLNELLRARSGSSGVAPSTSR
jgi:hypothetical protein